MPVSDHRPFVFALAFGTLFATSEIQVGRLAAEETNPVEATGNSSAQAQRAKPAASSLDDPLPNGARLRLGTSQFHPPYGGTELALSPDEKTVVTAGWQLIAWDAATGKKRWQATAKEFGLEGYGACYGSRTVAFSSDSSQFYSPGPANQAFMWDVVSGGREIVTIKKEQQDSKPKQTGRRDTDAPRSIDVTPDGKLFAVGGPDGVVVFNRQGDLLFETANPVDGPSDFDFESGLSYYGPYSYGRFSPNGRLLAAVVSGRPDELGVFNIGSGRELWKLKLAAPLVRLAFSPDGKMIAATEGDNAIRLYDLRSGQRVWSRVIPREQPIGNYASAVAFAPDGKAIAAAASDHRIYLLDSETGVEMGRLVGHRLPPWALAFTADGQILYSWGLDGPIRRWNVASRKQLPLPGGVHATEVVAASPDGQTLAYQADSGTVYLVAAKDGQALRKLELPGMQYAELLFTPDGRRVAGGGRTDEKLQAVVWDVATGELLHRWEIPHGWDKTAMIESLSFTPDGRRLGGAVNSDSAVFVWDLANGKQLAPVDHEAVFGLAFSPDGKTLATYGPNSIMRFWETDAWTLRREVKAPENAKDDDFGIRALCYAPEGNLLATLHDFQKVCIWQADTMQLRKQFSLKQCCRGAAMSFSPDGLWLAFGAEDGSVELWDSLSGKKVMDRGRHASQIGVVAFGRDSRTLVSGSGDGFCYVWDLRPPGIRSPADVGSLWEDLAGQDPLVAYRAMWAMSDSPDRATAVLGEKLRPVKSVIDFDHASGGESAKEKERRRTSIDKGPHVETVAAVRRGVALLGQLGTPAALQMLEDLEKRDPNGYVGRLASQSLNRLRRSSP